MSSTVIITLAGFAADKLSSPENGKPLVIHMACTQYTVDVCWSYHISREISHTRCILPTTYCIG